MNRFSFLVCFGCIVLFGCSRGADDDSADRYAKLMAFDTAQVRIATRRDTARAVVELAESDDQRTMGLMERPTLAPDAGMLFLYPADQPETSAFWMFRTRMPLDIAFIDSTGIIRTIKTMSPCPTTMPQGCPTYPADARYRAALEMNAGYFAKRGVQVGDRVLLGDTILRRPASRTPPVDSL